MKTIHLLLALLLFAASSSLAIDASLDGRITDSATAAGIEGATIIIEPVAPGVSLTAGTNPFGFYRKEPIPPAAYTLKVRHGAYLDHDEAFTPVSGAKVTRNIALTPRYPGVTTFDIFAQTFCTRTMMELGNVPIRVQRFLSENAAVVDETFNLTTDAKGGAKLRGVRPGWFTFRFNDPADGTQRPKWDALDKPQRRYLDTAHAAVAQLMPQGQTYNFRVIGLDARDPDIGPVPLDKVYAELTGVRYKLPQGFHFGVDDPEPYEIVALPTRTGETGPSGTPTPGNGSGRVRE
ncbi:MAG: carboxypeptidase-like regulatory domain-containing protein, partial [Chthoniobacteraceae bacterium]